MVMQIWGYTKCIMVYVKMVNSKLQKRSLFHLFFEGITLRILQMFANPNPNPLLNLRLLV